MTFEVYMRDNSWMGIVLGESGMGPGADMIQIKAEGINSRVYDKFSQGYISPAEDGQNNLDATFRFFEGDQIRFTITRALDTGDSEQDYLVPVDQEFDLGWAINYKNNEILNKHNEAGGLSLVLNSSGAPAFENTGALILVPSSAVAISSAAVFISATFASLLAF